MPNKKIIYGVEFEVHKGGLIDGDFIHPDKNIYFESSVEVKGRISVKNLSIEAGGSIEAGQWIKAGGWIEAGGSIEAGQWIKAGGWIFSFNFDISCKYFVTKTLPFYRNFYVNMPPLKKWREEILSNKCWNDYKKMVTKKEAEEICTWEGWHWIIRAQLEMFFGLKDKYIVKK